VTINAVANPTSTIGLTKVPEAERRALPYGARSGAGWRVPRDAGLLPLMNSAYYVTRRDDVPRSPRDPGPEVVLSASA